MHHKAHNKIVKQIMSFLFFLPKKKLRKGLSNGLAMSGHKKIGCVIDQPIFLWVKKFEFESDIFGSDQQILTYFTMTRPISWIVPILELK